ncbi:MAG: helix-turn-helix domain-containing protein [Candidatus Methylomirabilota bacterium]|jgi:excisionase family DNA binding protein
MPLLSIQQASDELGISRVGVERLLRLGRLPCVRIGRRVLVERKELDAFIAARRQRGKSAVESAEAVRRREEMG